MKNLIKITIYLLKILQNFPYEKTISYLQTLLTSKNDIEISPKIEGKLEINFKNEAIYINDIEIISTKAINLQKIFRILLEQFLQDSMEGKDFDNFRSLDIHNFSEILENNGSIIFDKEKQVRRPINRLQKALYIKFGVKIIDTIRYSYARKQSGYRLSPQIICFGAKDKCLSEKNSLMSE